MLGIVKVAKSLWPGRSLTLLWNQIVMPIFLLNTCIYSYRPVLISDLLRDLFVVQGSVINEKTHTLSKC